MVSISMEIMVKWGYYTIYPGGEKNPLTKLLSYVSMHIYAYITFVYLMKVSFHGFGHVYQQQEKQKLFEMHLN